MFEFASPLDGLRSPFGVQRGGALQRIIALFSDPAATGWVYDNQDLTTMFQDVAGTVPVTAPGQRVRLQLDKSGKGNHRRQPLGDAQAPVLGFASGRYYLQADGADDWLETSAFAWGTDEVSLCTGVRKLSDAGQACVVAIGLNGGPPGVNNENALMLAPVSAGSPTYWWRASGTVTPAPTAISGFPAPNSAVVTARAKVATDFQSLRVNGGIPVVESTDMGLGTFGTGTVAYFFRRGGTTAPFNGFEYANIGINRLLTPADLALVEGYVTGVTL